MKKIIVALALFAVSFAGKAQLSLSTTLPPTTLKSASHNLALDTVTSTAAHYMVSPVIKSFYDVLTVEITLTELSGTTAGTVSLQASTDGINWYDYYGSKDTSFTFSAADVASQCFRFSLSNWGDQYVRVKVVGVSTPNFTIAGNVSGKRRNS